MRWLMGGGLMLAVVASPVVAQELYDFNSTPAIGQALRRAMPLADGAAERTRAPRGIPTRRFARASHLSSRQSRGVA